MAPQLEASGAEPTLANCVQTALRILAAAPGMGSSRRPAYKGSFIHRGLWQLSSGTPAPPPYSPYSPSPSGDLGSSPGREKGAMRARSYLELPSQTGFRSILFCSTGPSPGPRCHSPSLPKVLFPQAMGNKEPTGDHRRPSALENLCGRT